MRAAINDARFISATLAVLKTFRCYASDSVSHCITPVSISALSLAVVKAFLCFHVTLCVSMHLAGLCLDLCVCILQTLSVYYSLFLFTI